MEEGFPEQKHQGTVKAGEQKQVQENSSHELTRGSAWSSGSRSKAPPCASERAQSYSSSDSALQPLMAPHTAWGH